MPIKFRKEDYRSVIVPNFCWSCIITSQRLTWETLELIRLKGVISLTNGLETTFDVLVICVVFQSVLILEYCFIILSPKFFQILTFV